VQYDVPLSSGSTFSLRLDANFQDDVFTSPTNGPFNLIEDYTLVNGRLSWRSADGSWQAAVEATNLTDELYPAGES
jgi:iron complex outermembrane receptor protein